MTHAISASGVTWWYERNKPIVDGLDLELGPGDVVSISGPNGSGKSTLLRVLVGVVKPQRGTIERATRVGYLPQSSDEPPVRLRARTWLGRIASMKGAASQDTFAEELRVSEALDGPLEALSVGTVTKVLLVAAFGGSPGLIVLDEPFAPLDRASRDALSSMIERAASQGAGVIVTSHDAMPSLPGEHLVLAGGRLIERTQDVRRFRVTIRTPDGITERIVTVAERDAVLREALDRGWDIVRVEERS
jgi:ABC-type Mn2+/Zn2+ transport system ATPase subunit